MMSQGGGGFDDFGDDMGMDLEDSAPKSKKPEGKKKLKV